MRLPSASKLSALTALNVPTPPASAQLPAEMPLEMETPLPPSTSGRTSTPPIRIELIVLMAVCPLKGQSLRGPFEPVILVTCQRHLIEQPIKRPPADASVSVVLRTRFFPWSVVEAGRLLA